MIDLAAIEKLKEQAIQRCADRASRSRKVPEQEYGITALTKHKYF